MSFSPPPLFNGVARHSIVGDARVTGLQRLRGLVVKALPALGVMGVCLAGALAFSLSMGPSALELTREGGIVENFSAIFYVPVLLCAVPMMLRGHRAAGLIGLMALLMGLRELDAHKAFTTYGVFKTRLYVSPDVSVLEKVLAGGSVLLLAALLVLALRWAWSELTSGRSAAGVSLLGVGVFGVLLKQVDALPRQLAHIGIDLGPSVLAVSKAVEECGEMGLPLLLALALFQLWRAG